MALHGVQTPCPARLLAQGLAHWIPGAELITLHGLGHMGPMTDLARVATLMRPF